MKAANWYLPLLLAITLFSCKTGQKTASTGQDDGIIEIVFLQMNDVYEISPLSDNSGGLARVAAIRKSLLAKNPNTFTVLAGDFISPSVIGTLKYDGKRIRGRQMVETLNTLGLDWVVFGNHEFDYDDLADLQARLDESNFVWLAGNAQQKSGDQLHPFKRHKPEGALPCPADLVVPVKDADGTTINLGVFGVLVNTGQKPFVVYSDAFAAAKESHAALKAKTDLIVGLTHLDVADDLKLAGMLPDVPLIMGGHDHDNMIHRVGKATVAKADANARTVYVHTLRYDKKSKTATVKSELRRVNGDIPDEPATAAVVAKWEKIKNESLSSAGFDAGKKVTELKTPLDCREAVVRHQQAPVGKYILDAMLAAAKTKPECAILNSGSIRVDDVLGGILTEIDVVRMLPFGGGISEVEMRGSLLRRTLDAGIQNKGKGGYLQLGHIARDEVKNTWLINKSPLDDAKVYRVVLPDFLLTGNEMNMDFLKTAAGADGKGTNNPGILSWVKGNPADKSDLRNDIRLALIDFLRKG
ncbi:MAG: bifunctional metallophosphatase/5'-nucleotidase [Thermoanaerobaculia bacterium]|nr:bifunctional metallophosphatase/5'-nucleotidase [Thermoanaerobaculia bacterium]